MFENGISRQIYRKIMNIQQLISSLCLSDSKLDFILDGDARFQFIKAEHHKQRQ